MPMLISLLLLSMSAAQAALPDWLVGEWCTEPEGGAQTCERWKRKGDRLEGTSEIRRERGKRPGERMRIEQGAAGLVFHAEPPGQAPADFAAVPPVGTGQEVVFEDVRHDYPQRVRYWREGERLFAEISLADGGRRMRWAFRRVAE
jgi:hypothetical protein